MTTDATTLDQLEITIALVASEETPEWLVVKTTVRINGESPLRNGDEFDFVDIAPVTTARVRRPKAAREEGA